MNNDTQKTNDMHIKQNQISYIMSFSVMLFFLFFMAGFYWGRRTALKYVLNQFESDSLADKLSYAFYTLQDVQDLECSESEDSEQAIAEESLTDNNQKAEISEGSATHSSEIAEEPVSDSQIKLYRAYLVGFGTEKIAQKNLNYMQSCGLDVELLTRSSKTPKGRIIKWYQIVTKPLADMQELQDIVEKAKKAVKLNNDIQIVTLEHTN